MVHFNRDDGTSVDRMLSAGNEVNDSWDAECSERLSSLSVNGSEMEVERSE